MTRDAKVVTVEMRALVYRSLVMMALAAALALTPPNSALAAKVDSELGEKEVKAGDEAAAQVAKDYKLSDNAADLKHVRELGDKIAAVANKTSVPALYGSPVVTPFKYTFDIVEDKDVNAFSLPGGHIYVNRGLLDFVQTDQELAGVLAHEVVHAAHHHMVFLLRKQASLQNQIAIALLATMIGGARSSDIGNVLMGVQLYQIAKVSGYGMEAERDADHGAVIYTHDAGYNPVGLLTFLERLAKRPDPVDYGIYRSHPLDTERVKAAKTAITDLGLPINRRDTTKAIVAEVKVDKVGGADVPGVYLDGKVIYRPAPADGKTSQQLANEAARKINSLLDSQPQIYEMKADPAGNGVIARNQALLVVSEADAKLMGKTTAEVSQGASAAIREVVWRQMVETLH